MMKPAKDYRKDVIFFKLGGSWDISNKNGRGKLPGVLDEEKLKHMEKKFGLYDTRKHLTEKELRLAEYIHTLISKKQTKTIDLQDKMRHIPGIEKWVKGRFVTLFHGESAHFRDTLVAPFSAFLLAQAWSRPETQIIGGQGSATADISLLPLLDTYLFDTHLPAIVFTGSNRTSDGINSDVTRNLYDLMRLTHVPLPSGAYWVFAGDLFSASDMMNVSPLRGRVIDDF